VKAPAFLLAYFKISFIFELFYQKWKVKIVMLGTGVIEFSNNLCDFCYFQASNNWALY